MTIQNDKAVCLLSMILNGCDNFSATCVRTYIRTYFLLLLMLNWSSHLVIKT